MAERAGVGMGGGTISRPHPELNGNVVLELQRGNWMGVCEWEEWGGGSLRLKDLIRDRKWAKLGLCKEMLNPTTSKGPD